MVVIHMTISDLALQYGAALVEPISEGVCRAVFDTQCAAHEFYLSLKHRRCTPFMFGGTIYFSEHDDVFRSLPVQQS